jgi:hypothetical protein
MLGLREGMSLVGLGFAIDPQRLLGPSRRADFDASFSPDDHGLRQPLSGGL